MLIQEEFICKNGVKQIHTYSDSGFFILQVETNLLYAEAYDNIPLEYSYIETKTPIEPEEPEESSE
jgi:hypothetical protein